jgi:hypothetical protein
MKRSICIAGLCGLALVGAGCGGDDNDTLSYDDTGAEIGAICASVEDEAQGITGDPKNDAPIFEGFIPAFRDAIQEVRDLDANEELEPIRDDFADNAEQQLALIEEAQAVAETGDKKEYRKALRATTPLDRESNELANQLGADACID